MAIDTVAVSSPASRLPSLLQKRGAALDVVGAAGAAKPAVQDPWRCPQSGQRSDPQRRTMAIDTAAASLPASRLASLPQKRGGALDVVGAAGAAKPAAQDPWRCLQSGQGRQSSAARVSFLLPAARGEGARRADEGRSSRSNPVSRRRESPALAARGRSSSFPG